MIPNSIYDLPFFEPHHRALAKNLSEWAGVNLSPTEIAKAHKGGSVADIDAACIDLVNKLGQAGWLHHTAPDPKHYSQDANNGLIGMDVRTLCIIRETLAKFDGLADFAFAMQGLGAGAISLFGTKEQREYLSQTREGKAIAAFALTEPQSGSDVANINLSAKFDGDDYILNGEKTWISNGGIADFYVIFARSGEGEGARGLSAFILPAKTKGLEIAERLEANAPHPLARLRLDNVRLPKLNRIGQSGEGFKIAMSVLDIFRSTVGAAALGFARRARDESVIRANSRILFNRPMADLQMVQGHIADMALGIDAASLLVYRAAYIKDMGAKRVSREAAMAKLYATETAQSIIEQAQQIHGADGVRKGHITEKLYQEIRALRIYEGASDVQKIIIAKHDLSLQ